MTNIQEAPSNPSNKRLIRNSMTKKKNQNCQIQSPLFTFRKVKNANQYGTFRPSVWKKGVVYPRTNGQGSTLRVEKLSPLDVYVDYSLWKEGSSLTIDETILYVL